MALTQPPSDVTDGPPPSVCERMLKKCPAEIQDQIFKLLFHEKAFTGYGSMVDLTIDDEGQLRRGYRGRLEMRYPAIAITSTRMRDIFFGWLKVGFDIRNFEQNNEQMVNYGTLDLQSGSWLMQQIEEIGFDICSLPTRPRFISTLAQIWSSQKCSLRKVYIANKMGSSYRPYELPTAGHSWDCMPTKLQQLAREETLQPLASIFKINNVDSEYIDGWIRNRDSFDGDEDVEEDKDVANTKDWSQPSSSTDIFKELCHWKYPLTAMVMLKSYLGLSDVEISDWSLRQAKHVERISPLNMMFFDACRADNTDIVDLLIQHGEAEMNTVDHSHYTYAASLVVTGCSNVLKLLLESGKLDINYTAGKDPDNLGNGIVMESNLLLVAINQKASDMVKLLVASKTTNVNIELPTGETPIKQAVQTGDEEVVKALLGPNRVDRRTINGLNGGKGIPPLHHAVIIGHVGIVRRLLKTRLVDINLQDEDGRTALDLASRGGHFIIKRIQQDWNSELKRGQASSGGMYYMDIQNMRGYPKIVAMLLKAGKADGFSEKDMRRVSKPLGGWKK